MIRPLLFAVALCAPGMAQANTVQAMIEKRALQELGPRWVQTALQIAKAESTYRCTAVGRKGRGGRPMGVFQVTPRTAAALGYNPARLTDCAHGVAAGIAHMKACLAAGVQTPHQMKRCHVTGFGWRNRRG